MSAGPVVIFDMDGVIFDTERLCLEGWQQVAERHAIPDVESTLRRCIGVTPAVTRSIFLERYGADFPMDAYMTELRAFFQRHLDTGLPVMAGAREILEFLRDKGIPTAIASSTPTHMVRSELAGVGLLSLFRETVGGDMAERSKPAPDIFLAAAAALDAYPADCFVIEDSYNGIRAAHAAGMRPLMVPDQLEPTEEIRALAEAVLPSLYEARAYLEERL